MTDAKVAAAIRLGHEWLWRHGDLEHLLHEDQRRVRQAIYAAQARGARRFVTEIARRWGKSVLHVTMACEQAIRNPGSRIVYGAPTLKMLEEFVHPAFRLVCRDAPRDCRPVWHQHDAHYKFPNGSWIHLFGADDEHTAGRGAGGDAVWVVFDEAAFTSVLAYVMKDVFGPALQQRKDKKPGFAVISSSPARAPAHDFTDIAELEQAAGNYATRSWHDNPLRTPEMLEEDLAELARQAGMTPAAYVRTATYRREYMGERVIEKTLVGVPEWGQPRDDGKGGELPPARQSHITAIERPRLYRVHCGLDFGGTDPHAAVWGYWHLKHGLVIEHELLLRYDEASLELSHAIKKKEAEDWGINRWDGTLGALRRDSLRRYFGDEVPRWATESVEKTAAPQPWLRVCDTDMKLARHLSEVGIAVVPTSKDGKQLHVQLLRNLINEGKLWIHPRCVNLDRHLCGTTWKDERRTEWTRRAGEHGDLVDALVYLVRNLERDVPLETPAPKSADLTAMLLGDSPMARKLRGLR